MYFRLLHDDASGTMSYLLADLDAGEAVVIDPRGVDVPVLAAMLDEHRLRLRFLLRTHEHDAHRPGEVRALETLQAPLIQGQGADGKVLPFGCEHVTVIATPGHTRRCMSYLWRDRLFCGGLLAVDGCPDQSHPADPEALWESVTRRVFALPAETLLFSGRARHARAVSTVLEERRQHAWFGGTSRDEFLARLRAGREPQSVVPASR